jgi:hypothetical protein
MQMQGNHQRSAQRPGPDTRAKIADHSSFRMIERVHGHLTNDDAYDAMTVMLRTSRDR